MESVIHPDLQDLITSAQLKENNSLDADEIPSALYLYALALRELNSRFETLPAHLQVQVLERLQPHRFWNTSQTHTALLEGAFFSHDVVHQAGSYNWLGQLFGAPLPHFGLTVSRGASIHHELGHVFREIIRAEVPRAYEDQGPERSQVVDMVKKQDLENEDRTVHFHLSAQHAPLAHVQIQTSRSEQELLHFENFWTEEELSDIGQRSPNEIRGELGRLFAFQEDTLKIFQVGKIPPPVRKLILQTLLAKAFYWMAVDSPLDALYLQVTPVVARKLQSLGLDPKYYSKKKTLSRSYDNEVREEFLIRIEKVNALKAANSIFKNVAIFYLKRFLEHPLSKGGKVILEFNRNELALLYESNILGEASRTHEINAFNLAQITPLKVPPRLISVDFIAPQSVSQAIQWFINPISANLRHPSRSFAGEALFLAPRAELEQHPYIHFHFSQAAAQEALNRLKQLSP